MEYEDDTTNLNKKTPIISSEFIHFNPPSPLSVMSSPVVGECSSSSYRLPVKKRSIRKLPKNDPTTPNQKPRSNRKPDPFAPKITRPCSECGKKFWSWKALFGHMRCHPERQWRGINPPPNSSSSLTEEEHEIATCLLMLANGSFENNTSFSDNDESLSFTTTVDQRSVLEDEKNSNILVGPIVGFECSSCKKVFGSHQALGGHRASHKNVKGCYAITNNTVGGHEEDGFMLDADEKMMSGLILGHKCSICTRVFSSGQALGGHMRCHVEKANEAVEVDDMLMMGVCTGFDLNSSPSTPPIDPIISYSYTNCSSLDLRLGL